LDVQYVKIIDVINVEIKIKKNFKNVEKIK